MGYIIVWNHNSRDSHIHTDSHGFIEIFEDREGAVKEGEACQDSEHYRDFILFEEDILKKTW